MSDLFRLSFSLNLVFGHTAAIMLAFHKNNDDTFALHNFLFFTGFILMSIYLILYPSTFSRLMKVNDLKKLLSLIAFSLILTALFVEGITLNIILFSYVSVLSFGLVYGVNLHLVTTLLPSYLHIDNIYKNMNYGKISASFGFMFSGLYVGYFSVSQFNLINFYYFMGIGALVISLLIILAKIRFKKLIDLASNT